MKEHRISKLNNKRGYSTEGSTLLPSVLRPRLFGSKDKASKEDKRIKVSVTKDNDKNNTPDNDALFKFGFSIRIGAIVLSIFALGITLVQASNVSAVQATLTIPDNISADVNPTANGGFAEGTPGQVEVSTNNQAGYTLSIKSKDGTELKNGSNSLQSITTNLTADQYKNSEYYNTWGFKPDVVNSLANTNYIPSPSTDGILLAKANTNSLLPETFNLAIATKVSQDAVAGNYANSFVLTATGNEARYNITFDNNGGTGGPQAAQTGLIGDDLEVQIESETPSMSGKDFLGWCTKKPKEDGSCTGVIVQPAGCFPLCKCDLNITLYAMYGTKSGSSSGGGVDSSDCSAPGYSGVAKSYGGLCWMWADYKTGRTWSQATTDCPNGWRLPSQSDFERLFGAMGTSGRLYYAGWNGGSYWSSTETDSRNAHVLSVSNSGASIAPYGGKTSTSYLIRCVAG